MSLVQEIKKKSSSRKKIIWMVSAVVWITAIYGGYLYFAKNTEDTIVAAPVEYMVKKWDITLWLTTEWTIQGDNILSLGFETSWKITSIKKNIGDTVKIGDVIWIVDDSQARVDLQKAQNSLSQAMINYSLKVQPLSDIEKQQIEWSLTMNKIDYDNTVLGFEKDIASSEKTMSDLEKKLLDYQDDLKELIGDESNDPGSTNEKEFAIQVADIYQAIKQNIVTIDEFLGISDMRRNKAGNYRYLIAARNSQLLIEAESLWRTLENASAPSSIALTQETINKTLTDIQTMRNLAAKLVDVMDATVEDANLLTAPEISSQKSTFSNMYTAMSSKYTTIAKSLETDTDQRKNIEQQIVQAKTDIEYQQTQIILKQKEIEQSRLKNDQQLANNTLDYTLKLDPLSSEEKQLAQLQLESARIAVQEKQLSLAKAQLRSPVDGVILTLTGHVGENAPSTFVTIATQGYTYVAAAISEDEVDLVKVGQKAFITPESVPDAAFEWEVYYVSTIGDTDNNGIVTYKVLVRYESSDERLRTAMNVEISFIDKQVKNVMIAPIKAVFASNNSPTVRLKDGTLKPVITGLSDGKQTEIISGVTVGDIILIWN